MKAETFNQQIYKQQTLHIKNRKINILILSHWTKPIYIYI